MAKTQSNGSSPTKRVKPTAIVEREIWAKAAGRCTLCAAYLFKAEYLYKGVAVGQIAHQVGATDAVGSPRGESGLDASERARAANLMLLCGACHKMVDDDPARYSVEWLARQKDAFERRVREVTNFPSLSPTVVLEFTSPIRGNNVHIGPAEVSEALQFAALRLAGEDVRDARAAIALSLPEFAESMWDSGSATINYDVQRVHRMFEHTQAESISVFALGPIPLLVSLGAAIGTKVPVHVFECHRGEVSRWRWPSQNNQTVDFRFSTSEPDDTATDIVVMISVTARVQQVRIPEELKSFPQVSVETVAEPRVGAISSEEALQDFSRVWRDALQAAETRFPAARTMHLFCATPGSISVETGRHRMRDASPSMVIYQLTPDETYVPATRLQ